MGGYVRFAGDENAASVPNAEELAALRAEVLAREGPRALNSYFHFKPVWQRAIVVAAGPLANFVLSIVLTAGLLAAIGERTLPARIDTITPSEPAAIAGFQPGDLIERADGQINSTALIPLPSAVRPDLRGHADPLSGGTCRS